MHAKWFRSVSLATVGLCLLCSCATTSSDQTRTKAEGTAAGALIGGVLGYLIGGNAKGTLIGAAIGAGAGFVVGNEIAKRKKQYASEEAFLEAEIQSASQYNTTARQYNESLQAEIVALDQSSMELQDRYEAGYASKQDLENKKKEIQRKLEDSQKFYETLNKEYEVKLAIYEEQRKKRQANDAYLVQLEKEVYELKNNLGELSAESKQLASIDERLTR